MAEMTIIANDTVDKKVVNSLGFFFWIFFNKLQIILQNRD